MTADPGDRADACDEMDPANSSQNGTSGRVRWESPSGKDTGKNIGGTGYRDTAFYAVTTVRPASATPAPSARPERSLSSPTSMMTIKNRTHDSTRRFLPENVIRFELESRSQLANTANKPRVAESEHR